MDYNSLIRKARSKNIRITKKVGGRRVYLTASELRRKLKRKKLRRKVVAKRTGILGRLFGGLFGRRRPARRTRKLRRKLRRNSRSKKICVCNSRRCKCRVKRNRLAKSGGLGPLKQGAFFAAKTLATGAAIQLGAEAAKRALMM
jgi:hypothetical protein